MMTVEEAIRKIEESKRENFNLIKEEGAALHKRAKIEKLLAENHVRSHGFDFEVYKQVLTLVSHLSLIVDANEIRVQAIKLSVVFGSYQSVVNYLKRYEDRLKRQNIPTSKLMHDACLFSLPSSEYWNVQLWNEIINKQNPASENDLILRLIPLADKIEKYIKDNEHKLLMEIRSEVAQELEKSFSDEFDRLPRNLSEEEYIAEGMLKNIKNIDRELNYEFDTWLRHILGIPDESKEKLTDARKNLSEEQKKVRDLHKSKIENKYRQKLEQEYKSQQRSFNRTKQTYIKDRLNNAKNIIDTITKNRAQHLLSPNTPMTTLKEYAKKLCYVRASENVEAADIFFSNYISEDNFNKYLSLIPQDDSTLIPDVSISGEEIDPAYKGYCLKKLDPKDPRAAILGKFTSCCQSLGEQGEMCAIHGITHPASGFYVLFDNKGRIKAQTWACRTRDGGMLFDSIESQIDFRKNQPNVLNDLYMMLAMKLVKTFNIPNVRVGLSGNTPNSFSFVMPPALPIDYYGYNDSHDQALIVEDKYFYPLFKYYRLKNPESKLSLNDPEPIFSKVDALKWCHMCYLSQRSDILNYVTSLELDLSAMESHYRLICEWGKKTYVTAEEIQSFLEKGIDINAPIMIFRLHAGKVRNFEHKLESLLDSLIRSGINGHLRDDDKNRFRNILKFYINNTVAVNSYNWTSALLHKLVECSLPFFDPNFFNIDNDTIFNYLLKNGVDINIKNDLGKTPLHIAVKNGWYDCLCYLLDKGADMNAIDLDGNTPLLLSVGKCRNELLRRGADLNVVNKKGYYIMFFYVVAMSGVDEATFIDLLTKRLTDLNKQDNEGKTTLDRLVSDTRVNLDNEKINKKIRLLIKLGAKFTSIPNRYETYFSRENSLFAQPPKVDQSVNPPLPEESPKKTNQ